MKLHLNNGENLYQFTGYGEDHVLVNGQRFGFGLLLGPAFIDRESLASVSFEALEERHFALLASLETEIILLGTGATLRFPHPSLTHPLIDARIGLEVMDTGSVCRTYNILASEGRKVVAAILA